MVGPSVVEAFQQGGFSVRTLSNQPPQPGVLPPAVEVRTGDVADSASVREAVKGASVVVHLAALLHMPDPPAALCAAYERTNVGGTRAVVEASLAAGVERVVFFSTIAVYGDGRSGVITEESVPRPDSYYAQTKLAAEEIVLEARRSNGSSLGTVLRLGAVYGSRIKGNYGRLVRALDRRRFIPIGAGRTRRSMIYDRDAAAAAVLAMGHPAAAGRVFNVTDGQFHELRDIIAAVCAALGRTPPQWSVPVAPARAGAAIVEGSFKAIGRRPPITRATIDKYTEDLCVDSGRIQRDLGFRPAYDLHSGWREAIEMMRQAGQV
jgi:UDP-glucose 4-epimerase